MNEIYELEKNRIEISEIIREERIRQNVSQAELYHGLCTKKAYIRLENGEGISDELLTERICSRLHIQYRLLEVMLNDEEFWQKECRVKINKLIWKKEWEQAEKLILLYEEHTPENKLHKQYSMAGRAKVLEGLGEYKEAEAMYQKALELTLPVPELEKRLTETKVISEEELELYFHYRVCEKELSLQEYAMLLKQAEEIFPAMQIYAEVYFYIGYRYAKALYEQESYRWCLEVCDKLISVLRKGVKRFYLSELYFLQVMAGMRLQYSEEEEKEMRQQCKTAYYVGVSFGEKEMTKRIAEYYREEFGCLITG